VPLSTPPALPAAAPQAVLLQGPCCNCNTATPSNSGRPRWRKALLTSAGKVPPPGSAWCDACGAYYALYGVLRPERLWKVGLRAAPPVLPAPHATPRHALPEPAPTRLAPPPRGPAASTPAPAPAPVPLSTPPALPAAAPQAVLRQGPCRNCNAATPGKSGLARWRKALLTSAGKVPPPGSAWCDACGAYYALHGVLRPERLWIKAGKRAGS
jgi:hypothetical protein